MAIPAWSASATLVVITTGSAAVALTSGSAGDLIILQVFQDDNAASAVSITPNSVCQNLAGTSSALTDLALSQAVGGATLALQHLWIGRQSANNPSVTVATTGNDLYCSLHKFTGVSTGTTLATVIENSSAGSFLNTNGDTAQIQDQIVTTLGVDRLACNFIAVNDDNQASMSSFTGTSGGTWVQRYADGSSTGTDGAIGLQTADKATAGTINEGTFTMAAADAWGNIGFALIPTAAGGTTYTKAGYGVESA